MLWDVASAPLCCESEELVFFRFDVLGGTPGARVFAAGGGSTTRMTRIRSHNWSEAEERVLVDEWLRRKVSSSSTPPTMTPAYCSRVLALPLSSRALMVYLGTASSLPLQKKNN